MPASRSPSPAMTEPAETVQPVEATVAVVVAEIPQPRHKIDCPESRTETFTSSAPSGAPLTINRCIDCGEQVLVA